VRQLISKGAKVGAFDVQVSRLEALKAEFGDKLYIHKVDISKEEEVKAAIEAYVAKFGALHAVVNCAGVLMISEMISKKGILHNTKIFTKLIEINLFGALYVSKYASI
jgi:NAD(P)-dependent dehydrogenase (short-subunit alcohol dehydrogenase family)